ncbi:MULTISPECIES: M26 family metallopeptidase [Prevotellaceae]|uniref:hypothetical protein n=1 Tax=Prevotellaceae TaxID=171552 RepID=UPI0003D31DCB|nr:hypothetical protein [Prevotella phocaeensis]ETD18583.1 hypothetical protein HMPREF1199_01401 [Hoylesella oralis CC98A]
MKTKNFIQRLSLFLFTALMLATPAGAQNNNEMSIGSKEDWKSFCDRVNNGETGLNAKLTADVDLDEVRMVGEQYSYTGTFDGQGHTLTLNWDAGEEIEIAPFQQVDGATIRNLRVKGQITTQELRLAGLVCDAYGTTTITGCATDVRLTGGYGSNASEAAGLVRWIDDARVTITDCVVKGSIDDKSAWQKMAGFVYVLRDGFCSLTNCLYIGTNNAIDNGNSYTFAPEGATFNNCYYLHTCGRKQGEPITDDLLQTGYVTTLLQNNRTDACHWAQVLGDTPSPYREADKAKANYVYYDTANSRWACDNLRLTDGTALPIALDFTAASVTYERTISSAGIATICLPYELPVSGFRAYSLLDNQGDKLRFKRETGTLEAYRPYLIKADATVQLGGTNLQVKTMTAERLKQSAGDYTLEGVIYSADNAGAAWRHAYILQRDGLFHKVNAGTPAAMVPPCRAFITSNSATEAKALSIAFDDDGTTTAIDAIPTDHAGAANTAPVYDLTGRYLGTTLNGLPAGVYIVGGRKVILK